jgi:hypothetical protein
MTFTATDSENQAKLKAALQDEKSASKLENLAAALLGRLLGITVPVAKSGFQHGGDAGPAGRQGRRLRIECKKYKDTSSLSDRELLGEIDHALARDPALEAWVLVATREVSEQIEQDLNQHGESLGVPVIILDWKGDGLAELAALCAYAPDLVTRIFSPEAGALAQALQSVSGDAIDRIKRDLQAWSVGFESLRAQSVNRLEQIWNSRRASQAALGQDGAGGAQAHRIRRKGVFETIQNWWSGGGHEDAPLAVVGLDGVGKTWATLDWLVDRKADLPIILVVPSSAAADLRGTAETAVKRFLADRLYELAGIRDRDHWLRRLDNLLKRPSDEGPVLVIFFDGLNQEPSVPWLSLLKVLQSEPFACLVRVVVSARTLYFENKLARLRGLVVPALVAPVDVYDLSAGSELDQMLEFEGLERSQLNPDLVPFARNPRLFRLVVQLRERLVEAGRVTVHGLLWEYGRDSFGDRAGQSFSEDEWRAWLAEIATRCRAGIQGFTLKSLGETANRPDLTQREVYARLSDIVDGHFTTGDASTGFQLTPTVVAHALGAALLNSLDSVAPKTFERISVELNQWLDPIAGLDQRAEILRAAVSIYVERGVAVGSPVGGVLVTAWLQTQNVSDAHRRELAGLAASLVEALLDALEQSSDRTHASARLWAVNALRAIDRGDLSTFSAIVARVRAWNCVVSRGVETRATNAEIERNRSQRFLTRVGIDASGPLRVLGHQLRLVDRDEGPLALTAASILEGFPLEGAVPVFETAAIARAVDLRHEGWESLKWLCLLNEMDPDRTATALRAKSLEIKNRLPEAGINSGLPARAATFLLLLTGQEDDEIAAAKLNPQLDPDPAFSYENDYLANPGRSLFVLERRHAEAVLSDKSLLLLRRADRSSELWLDPTFTPPAAFVEEVRDTAAKIDVERLHRHRSDTVEDHHFELLEPVLARCAPDVLSDLTRRNLRSMVRSPAESRYWCALNAIHALVLAGDEEAKAARSLRLNGREKTDGEEYYAIHNLLVLEILDLESRQQVEAVVTAELPYILTDLGDILGPLSRDDADTLIGRFGRTSGPRQKTLLTLLGVDKIAFSDTAWKWLLEGAFGLQGELQGFAFIALTNADAKRFGHELLTRDWSWSAEKDYFVSDYGTEALIAGALELPLEQFATRLAPWRLLEAARRRGGDPAEVRFAAQLFSRVIAAEGIESPDPGSDLSVYHSPEKPAGFLFSVAPRKPKEESEDPAVAFRTAFDFEAQQKVHQRAVEVAAERWREARRSGASLYLASVVAEDFEPVLRHAPDLVDDWLAGSGEMSSDFARRVHLAEGAYLALCEALLKQDPPRGAALWRSLRATLKTRFVGGAQIKEIIHLPFRVPDSSPVNDLRIELVSPHLCHTDQALFNVALAAEYNHHDEWLANIIGEDLASSLAWRRMRGRVLQGFTANNTLPIADAWAQGPVDTAHEQLRWHSARFRFHEASAHHWWRAFWSAQDVTQAYAAWILFVRSADRRAWIWMDEEARKSNDGSKLYRLKLNHVRLNRSELLRAMEKPEQSLEKTFLDRETVVGLGPWTGLDA